MYLNALFSKFSWLRGWCTDRSRGYKWRNLTVQTWLAGFYGTWFFLWKSITFQKLEGGIYIPKSNPSLSFFCIENDTSTSFFDIWVWCRGFQNNFISDPRDKKERVCHQYSLRWKISYPWPVKVFILLEKNERICFVPWEIKLLCRHVMWKWFREEERCWIVFGTSAFYGLVCVRTTLAHVSSMSPICYSFGMSALISLGRSCRNCFLGHCWDFRTVVGGGGKII